MPSHANARGNEPKECQCGHNEREHSLVGCLAEDRLMPNGVCGCYRTALMVRTGDDV